MSAGRQTEQANQVAGEIDLFALARILWRQRLIIASTTIIATITALALSFMLPKTYAATATILPSSGNEPSMGMAANVAAQFGIAAGMLGGTGRSGDLVEILSSRSMAERIIRKCNLESEIKAWKTRNDLSSKVMSMVAISGPGLKSKVIEIKVQAPKPELAARMANAYVDELKDMLDEIGYNYASKNRKFVQQQLVQVKHELVTAEDRLSQFQASNHLASLPEAVIASIRSVSDLEAQKINTGVQLKSTEETLGVMRSKVNAIQMDPNALNDLELKRSGLFAQQAALGHAQQVFVDKLSKLPAQSRDLARLQRDVQVLNAIYLALSQQYETSMIGENRESDAFLALDKAVLPDWPIAPKKTLITLSGLLMGVVLGVLGGAVRHLAAAKTRAQ